MRGALSPNRPEAQASCQWVCVGSVGGRVRGRLPVHLGGAGLEHRMLVVSDYKHPCQLLCKSTQLRCGRTPKHNVLTPADLGPMAAAAAALLACRLTSARMSTLLRRLTCG